MSTMKSFFSNNTEKLLVTVGLITSITLSISANARLTQLASEQNVSMQDSTTNFDDSTENSNLDSETLESEYEVFVNCIFSDNGNHYVDENNNTFYSDPDCTKEIPDDNLRFITHNIGYIQGEDSHGNSIHCYLLENREIAYIPSNKNVNLVRID